MSNFLTQPVRRVMLDRRVVGTVQAIGARWSATSVYGGRAWAPSQARARTWVLMQAEQHIMIPVAALTGEADRLRLVALANKALGHYPQYRGYWDRCTLGRVRCDVHTKFGRAFTAGELVLVHKRGRREKAEGFVTCYSVATEIDTQLDARKVEMLVNGNWEAANA